MSFGFIPDPLKKNAGRDEGRKLAQKFGGKGESVSRFTNKFNHMWELTWRAKTYADDNHAAMQQEVSANLSALGDIVAHVAGQSRHTGMSTRSNIPGGRADLTRFRSAPVAGSYVVFSDIHITDADNRQNFFAGFNKDLYLDVLSTYYAPREFGLIENGDIEELLIFEPDLATMPDYENASWSQILADRETRKRAQFQRILADHADFYRTIHDGFVQRGAYYRTIGNHDYDLASTAYVTDLRDTLGLPNWPTASDMVFLTEGDAVAMMICHGHQFDAYCVAGHAKKAGESFSQGGGWAYQGPDRFWDTENDAHDFIDKWRNGTKAFNNMLVSDDPGLPHTDWQIAGASIAKELNDLHDPNRWEALYGKNIAWEYFTHSDPQDAFNIEVANGERWYKFRHMDEHQIVAAMDGQFGQDGMQLLLGHSHEPRIRAGRANAFPHVPAQAGNYLNSAAAGRFENLVWGIEIVNGVSTVVSWSREGSEIVRNVWTDDEIPGLRYLMATEASRFDPQTVVEGPEEEEASNFPLEAITNLMFSR